MSGTRTTLEFSKKGKQAIPSYVDRSFVNSATKDRLEHLVAPHVDSFNYFLNHGLLEAINDIPENEFNLGEDLVVRMKFTDVQIGYPQKNDDQSGMDLTPREARERGLSYTGVLTTTITMLFPLQYL